MIRKSKIKAKTKQSPTVADLSRITSIDEVKTVSKQHTVPCHDCPFKADAVPGWLGGYTPAEYTRLALGDEDINCHALALVRGEPLKCAGHSIFRANVCKMPRPMPGVKRLTLKADKKNVLGFNFKTYHEQKLEKCGYCSVALLNPPTYMGASGRGYCSEDCAEECMDHENDEN